MRRLQPDGVCGCCGRVGATFADVERTAAGFVTAGADRCELPPLCVRCEEAQRRWEAKRYELAHPGAGYPYLDAPPKSPPVRRN